MILCCRPVASAGKIGGWISVVFTFMTLFNATLMFFFKPEVLKYRGVLGHMVQRVGKAVTGRLPHSTSAPDLDADDGASCGGTGDGSDTPHLERMFTVRTQRRLCAACLWHAGGTPCSASVMASGDGRRTPVC